MYYIRVTLNTLLNIFLTVHGLCKLVVCSYFQSTDIGQRKQNNEEKNGGEKCVLYVCKYY